MIPLGATAAQADWQDSPVEKYVAVGDSYAAGQGAGAYQNNCLVSDNGYPALLDNQSSVKINLLRNPSCSGDTTADVVASQLASLNHGTTLVTITAGANDLGVYELYSACTAGTEADCNAAIAAALTALPGMSESISSLIGSVQERAPRATIVVTGYAVPFASTLAQPESIFAQINDGVSSLNGAIQAGVLAHSSDTVLFASVDFTGHQIGSADPWLNTNPADFMHPNAAGYAAYAEAILATLG